MFWADGRRTEMTSLNRYILDVQYKYILALVNMAATVSYSCYNAEPRFEVRFSLHLSNPPKTYLIFGNFWSLYPWLDPFETFSSPYFPKFIETTHP